MKFILQNKNGMFLQAGRDFSFTANSKEALTFSTEQEAERRSRELMRFGVKVVTI
tara:strand:- start:213 stop:377 length:165 start_codon:yes stop_codon:yes gene_type:complete